ncbi:MAG: hypothetical protein N2645_03015 [Clostridia bacterium]|nr:hypothetical protein [Clostridia bacterium]
MNMEKTIIGRTIGYLISRDILLAILVLGHISVYYHFFSQINFVILPVLVVGAFLWILFFTKLIRIVSIAKKDKYLVTAFSDEYFSNIKMRAGYNGYIIMVLCCLIFIFGSVLLNILSIGVDIPVYIAFEIVMLLGVVTDDISKILLSRG